MMINCPNCVRPGEQHAPPVRGAVNVGELWACCKCPAVICVGCYVDHIQKAHPEVYQVHKRPTGAHKKNKKSKK